MTGYIAGTMLMLSILISDYILVYNRLKGIYIDLKKFYKQFKLTKYPFRIKALLYLDKHTVYKPALLFKRRRDKPKLYLMVKNPYN